MFVDPHGLAVYDLWWLAASIGRAQLLRDDFSKQAAAWRPSARGVPTATADCRLAIDLRLLHGSLRSRAWHRGVQ